MTVNTTFKYLNVLDQLRYYLLYKNIQEIVTTAVSKLTMEYYPLHHYLSFVKIQS